jgi:uncharacterized protein YqkB
VTKILNQESKIKFDSDVLPTDSTSVFCKDAKENDYNSTKERCVVSSCPTAITMNLLILFIGRERKFIYGFWVLRYCKF